MVVLNRIYTRTGDDGTTSLGSGDRRKKYDLRVDAYGTLDEVNATIGLVRLHTAGDACAPQASAAAGAKASAAATAMTVSRIMVWPPVSRRRTGPD